MEQQGRRRRRRRRREAGGAARAAALVSCMVLCCERTQLARLHTPPSRLCTVGSPWLTSERLQPSLCAFTHRACAPPASAFHVRRQRQQPESCLCVFSCCRLTFAFGSLPQHLGTPTCSLTTHQLSDQASRGAQLLARPPHAPPSRAAPRCGAVARPEPLHQALARTVRCWNRRTRSAGA